MDTRSRRTPISPIVLVVRLAMAALVVTALIGPATADAAQPAPLVAQQGPCGDRPCGEVPPDQSPCGDKPCDQVPITEGPCGPNPCAEAPPPGQGPCGDKPCAEVPPDQQTPCGDRPCGEVPPQDVNKPPADAAPPPEEAPAETPATTTAPGQEGSREGRSERALDADNASSSSSWILPVLFVLFAGLVLFWLVRRNRTNAEGDV